MNKEKLMHMANTIADIATSLEKKIFYFIIVAIISVITIAWHWVDFTALSLGSGFKLLLLVLPVLLWLLLWNLIKQLTDLPQNLSELKELGEENLSLAFNSNSEQEKKSKTSVFASLFRLIQTIREPEILENILVCAKGLTVLVNPISFVVLILSTIVIITYIFIALVLAIF